jgi:hypothetical protein
MSAESTPVSFGSSVLGPLCAWLFALVDNNKTFVTVTMGKIKDDEELTGLLTKLYTIQEDIGAKPKTSDEDKRAKAENAAIMGKGKKTEKKGSRFLQLKSAVLDRLKSIHQLLKDTKELESAGYGGDNAKDIIKMQAEVREQIRQATDEWRELDEIYKKEARKKKSKFSPEELEVQAELVKRLYAEIEKVKEAQMRGYAKGRAPDAAVALNTKAMAMDSGTYSLVQSLREMP